MSEDRGDDRAPVDLFGATKREGIAGELIEGAQRLALRALKAYVQDDHEVSALHAGVSVERLAKWALASRNPVFIADLQQTNKSFRHLLHLSGVKEQPSKDLRTVGLGGALDRLRELGVFNQKERDDLQGLVNRRNGVIHVTAQDEDAEAAVSEFISTAERLLADRGESREWFWGNQLALVDEVRAQADRVIERAVHLRIQVARSRYYERVSGMAPGAVTAWAASARDWIVRMAQVSGKFGAVLGAYPCPACGSPALVVLDLSPTSTPDTLQTEGNFRQLDCQICAFEMHDRSELAAAEFDVTRVELADLSRAAWVNATRGTPSTLNQAEVDLFLTLDHKDDVEEALEPYIEGDEDDDEAESEGESYEP